MASLPPPSLRVRSRPLHLAFALVAATVIGVFGSMTGCGTIALYNHARVDVDVAADAQSIQDAADRAAVTARYDRYHDVLDGAKSRMFPLAAAELLLGSSIFLLAGRAMAGRASARNLLLQVLVAQALLDGALYLLTADVRLARAQLWIALVLARAHDSAMGSGAEGISASSLSFVYQWDAIRLVIDVVTLALIVLSLTRPRARAFFEEGSASEQEP